MPASVIPLASLFSKTAAHGIAMDEIGPGENDAVRFRNTIASLPDGEVPIIGVVQDKPGVLPDLLRNHPEVKLVTVTAQNRDEIRLL